MAIYGVDLDDGWQPAHQRAEPPGTMRAPGATITGPLVVWADGQPEVGAALMSAVRGDVRYVPKTPHALDRELNQLAAGSTPTEETRKWQQLLERT